MSFLSKVLTPLVRLLPAAPCVWNGRVLWMPRGHWGSFHAHYEQALVPFLRQELRTAGVFLDVGAHHGYWTTWACRLNPDLQVVAVEPSRISAAILRRFVICNGLASRVTILEACLSTHSDGILFHDSGDVTSGVSQAWAKSRGQHVVSYWSPSITLERLIADQVARLPASGTIVCKLDIEGHEEAVFEKCCSLEDQRVRFFVEVHNCQDVQQSRTYLQARAAGREVRVVGQFYESIVTIMF